MKKNPFFLIAFLFSAASLFSADWVLGAAAFEGDEELSKTLPVLILGEVPENLVRSVSPEEQLARHKKSLLDERKSLLSKMKSDIDARNSVLFEQKSDWQKKESVASYEKKIAESRDAVLLNMKEYDYGTFEAEKLDEPIVLYGKKSDSLYSIPSSGKPDGVNGLIRGTVKKNGDFIYLKTTLTIYPGEIEAGSYETVASVYETDRIAPDVVSKMLDSLVNASSSFLSVIVGPEEIADKTLVRVDDMVVKNFEEFHSLQKGVHDISVECPGYKTRSFSIDISEYNYYKVDVLLEKLEFINLSLNLKKEGDSASIFVGGKSGGTLPADVVVNGLPLFGEVVSEEGASSFVYLKRPSVSGSLDGKNYSVKVSSRKESSTKILERSRKRMYWSYGALLATLPFTFFTTGRVNVLENKAIADNGWLSEAMKTEYDKMCLANDICSAVSITAGVNMVIQLTRYIFAANSVLPEIIEPEEN